MKSALICLTFCLVCASAPAAEKVALIKINGAIGPATASYIARSIDEARTQNAQCLVIQLNTPGGLLDSTQTIVQDFLGSTVPVVVYVSPTGATATSAGCFITLAANVAAMAPATTIGAAHPVMLGGIPSGQEQKPDDTMKQKLENFSVSYIETIAAKRHRNVDWAKSAVRESASITAEKALELRVIDLIAADTPELLKRLNGRVVDGKTLSTAAAEIAQIKMSPSERVFQQLWRPEVMFILMLIAIYGIIGEMTTPGAILPGVVGAIALILALYLAAILPVNVTGIVLIAFSSCKKKYPDVGGTAAEKMANEWWAELKLDGDNVYGPGEFAKIATYNTAANTNEIWVDDLHGLWDFKVKATADFNNLTFSADQAVSVIPNYDIKVNITEGKVLMGAGHSKTGNITDSIYMKVEFEDDPGTIYTIEGHGRTRFAEDDY